MAHVYVTAGLIVLSFTVGQRYGARVEEEAVEAAVAVLNRAYRAFKAAAAKALVDVQAKEARIKARVEKFL